MLGPCAACGRDPGFEWTVCTSCGAPAGTPERTVIEPNRGPSVQAPVEGERARLGSERNYYRPVSRDTPAGTPPLAEATVVERPGGTDATVRMAEAAQPRAAVAPGRPRGAVKPVGPLAYFVQRNGAAAGTIHQVGEETTIGRSEENDVVVPEASVSKQHARVRLRDGQFIYWDLASSNFSFLVGPGAERTRILEPLPLGDGTTIELGDARLTFLLVRGEA